MQNKKKVEEEEKALAVINKQVEEELLAVWNKQQFKGKYRNCGKYGHKVVYCPEKKSEEKHNGTKSNIKCHFSGKCFYCGKVGHRVNECCSKKAVQEKAKVVNDQKRTKE